MSELEHVDVLVVGAGLSGIGAACHLRTTFGDKTVAILEARDDIGGTWDLFRYPGIRSDSDMFTLGYRFRPWREREAIADGPAILNYVRETAHEYGVYDAIRFNHRVVRAEWSSADARWTVTAERTDTAETVRLTCDFLFSCSGYYRYDEGYTPDFPGTERFSGRIVHPQHWPEDLDYAGKRVVVIGSGATAVTLVPAMAPDAAHVTMLQRSPSYIITIPGQDAIATGLRKALPDRAAYMLTRWKNVLLQIAIFQLSRRRPAMVRALLKKLVRKQLPRDYDVETHFNPDYNPWDQRLCLVPDGDLFKTISEGAAYVVTDHIDTFDESGIRLTSGRHVAADVIVTATGLNLLAFGGMELVVDGREINLPETMAYKGVMLTGVPNFAYVIGYTNASWTLKADLACEYLCRLLAHMDTHGYDSCVVERDPTVAEEPFLDLSSGYVRRALDRLPAQGDRLPWKLRQNYLRDVVDLRHGKLYDDAMTFSTTRTSSAATGAAGRDR
ncbi:Predicted flavoprotein CzcO associated with the cation diffusion facilitator CzcD [Haloechinothrix alba]|uniref:Predicted flavoprotein CzcO associated with the cation diffusion facilitator CzcD n=1 Tax=Haloechinothrix alba TaxID=664784 RepID=A0A238V1H0_9PSEU|nr:NAD(P)/FAD-dependent oxidoreductase [Haloechinothrix alba]SNR28011.1 Predicted flavoprotein CzcO associated with the cation diffusion facilitator CzcD [Haloechinothrix alba]